MNYKEMKDRITALIVELVPNSEMMNDSKKFNRVVNHVMFELERIKRISEYVEVAKSKGKPMEFADRHHGESHRVEKKDKGKHVIRANGTVHEITDEETAEIDRKKRPKRITPRRANEKYEFELGADLLELLPYGVVVDLLKDDISDEYGILYDGMLQSLDPRNTD